MINSNRQRKVNLKGREGERKAVNAFKEEFAPVSNLNGIEWQNLSNEVPTITLTATTREQGDGRERELQSSKRPE